MQQEQPAQQSNKPKQLQRKHDRLITRDMALVMLATFCFMSSNMLANPIVAGYAESLGASGMLMGVVAGSMSFISLFCRPIAGNLSDRTSKRTLVTAGTVLYFTAGLLYYFANSPIMLIMARVINGVGFACCSVCLATWMSLLLPIRHMGAGMGLYGTMNALAMAVGPALGIRAQKYIGYRLTFLSSLILAAIMLIATLMVKNGGQPVRKKQPSTTENPSLAVDIDGSIDGSAGATKKHHLSIRSILEPRVVPLSLTFMMFAIAYFANQSFIMNYVEARHLPVSADLFFMFYAVTLLVLRMVLRDLFDSKGFRSWLTLCSLGMLAMLACMTFLFNDWMLLLAAFFTAVGYGLMSSVTQAQAVVIAGRERSGIANSTYYAGIDLGMSVGPFVGGLVYGRLPVVWFYPVFMLTVPVAWLIYWLCVRRVSR
ncbi:MFS transporter [Bifidobacterium catenulatum]|uniref:MFS transporter n=2 Tax=Bifidobacterium TaxID=1678 RepID=UPI000C161409|nr:MFS transporter [Bifidobacterium sp. N4G05]PIB84846.1 MFS transporter [Bifidobacterium sp. N4G05]